MPVFGGIITSFSSHSAFLNRRFAIRRSPRSANLILHFSYDRVFSKRPLLRTFCSQAQRRLSRGTHRLFSVCLWNFRSATISRRPDAGAFEKTELDIYYFRRVANNDADDDQSITRPSVSRLHFKKRYLWRRGKLDYPSGENFHSWLLQRSGQCWNPVTGGLVLGNDATAAETELSGDFPASQDQRNTVEATSLSGHPRFWLAGGIQYHNSLPFEFDGDPSTALASMANRYSSINFDRGRVDPFFQVNASGGVDLHNSEKLNVRLQADGQNLTNILNVIDFGGLFSGNSIGPPRSFLLRLTTTF